MRNAKQYMEKGTINLSDSLIKIITDSYNEGAREAFNSLWGYEHIKEDDLDAAWDKISQIIE